MGKEILKMEHITKIYPNGVMANRDVSFSVHEGEIHALMGENGAGDTFQCGHSNEQRLCNQNDRAGCGNAGIEWHKYSEKQYRRCRYSEDEYRLARYSG